MPAVIPIGGAHTPQERDDERAPTVCGCVEATGEGAYALVNAKIGYEKDNWDVFLYGRNLLDQRYATSAFGRSKRAAEPLMVGVQCGLSF